MSRIHKVTAVVGLVLWALCLVTGGGSARPNEQTVPTAPPPTATITPGRTPTSPGQPTVIATEPRGSTATQTQVAMMSPTSQGGAGNPPSEPSATGITGGGTIPLVTGTIKPVAETSTAVSTPKGPTSTVIAEGAGGGSRGLGTFALVAGLGLLLVAAIVWWVRSRRSDTAN